MLEEFYAGKLNETSNALKLIEKLGMFAEGRPAQNFITVLIVLNAITLGLETEPDIMATYGPALHLFDKIILAIFTVEILFKLLYRRLDFFKNG